MCYCRLEFDENLKNKLPKMFENLKTKLYEVSRSGELCDDMCSLRWMVDFSPDSVINTALRKENILDFGMVNEGNVYNNIFFKVKQKRHLHLS